MPDWIDACVTPVVAAYFVILAILCFYGAHRLFLTTLYHRHLARSRRANRAVQKDRDTSHSADSKLEREHARYDRAGVPEAATILPATPPDRFDALPRVTVQLPVFNEPLVIERLVDAVARLDYPTDRLQIQILDDSTDATTTICDRLAKRLHDDGLDVEFLHRTDRTGFKAGALHDGLASATGEFVAIFDADFIPKPSFLRDVIHRFTDPDVGLVQARWGHLNADYSPLTRAQAVFLDAHFLVEHTVRNASGYFFNFNGTAGIWRRRCIDDAGGWLHDTLTEDLDLSYRAQLRGWRFVFLPAVVAPAELPIEMDAFKSQQYRWTKGSVQVARKMLPTVWRSRIPLRVKIECTIHLTANITYLLLLVLALLLVPAIVFRAQTGDMDQLLLIDLPIFFFGTLAVADFFLTAQRQIGRGWRALTSLPVALALGMGLCLNNARAVLSALVGRQTAFVRTPKYAVVGSAPAASAESRASDASPGPAEGDTADTEPATEPSASGDGEIVPPPAPEPPPRRRPRQSTPYVELLLGLFFVSACVWAVLASVLPSLPFLILFAAGFLYCGLGSLVQRAIADARQTRKLLK